MTRRGPDSRAVLALPLTAIVVGGCGAVEERFDDAATDALDSAIEREVNRSLDDAGVPMAEPVDCTTDGDVSLGSLSGDIVTSCSGTTADDLPVSATFDGVVSTDGCDGVLNVVVEGRQVFDGPVGGADCAL